MKQTCFIYLRHSGYGPSKDEQLCGLLAFIKEKNIKLLKVYEEVTSDGQMLEQMVNEAKAIPVNLVLVWRLDRIDVVANSLEKTVLFIGRLNQNKVSFRSLEEGLCSEDPGNIFIPRVIEAVKKSQSLIRGDRVHQSLKQARLLGEPVGRPRLRDDKVILSLRSQGLTIRAIAKKLGISTWSVQNALKQQGQSLDI